MNLKLSKKAAINAASLVLLVSASSYANAVGMQKQNTAFSIDGSSGARQGQQIYLFQTNTDNVNQQWVENSVGSGYFTYQKQNTNLCIDGGAGARNRQAVTIESCDSGNQDQHWEKVTMSNGSFRLEKRGSNFSIDGNNGAANRQEIYLWQSSDNNANQQWQFLGENGSPTGNNAPTVSFATLGDNNRFDEGEQVSVTVNASDSNGEITSVSLSIDNEFVRTESRAPYGWGSRDSALQNLSPGTYRLTAVAEDDDGLTNTASATITVVGDTTVGNPSNPDVNVFSLAGLREAVRAGNNQTIIMQSGNYNITELPRNDRRFVINGDNNVIDLTGVHIDIPVNATEEEHFLFLGSGNTLRNGTIENTYPNGEEEITDFVSYNEDRDNLAVGNDVHIRLTGSDNSVIGTKIIVRGSFPFGYGSYFGIGRNQVFRLVKRGGIQIGGRNALIDGVEVYLQAFGHAIYMQDDADNTIVRNCLVEGLVRETNDMLAEGPGSLPDQANYRDEEGNPIPANEVESLAEDGIRSYGRTGSVTVDNCVVRGMRGGIRLYLASRATVSNTTAVDNGAANWNLPGNGRVTNSAGNFTYAPINDHRLGRSGQDIEMTILPSPNAIGSHNIADILGNDHDIVFQRAPGPEDTQESRVIVVSGDGSTIRNETEYTIVIESGADNNRIISAGDVIDSGRNNNVSSIPLDLN